MNVHNTYASQSRAALKLLDKLHHATKATQRTTEQTYGKAVNQLNKAAKANHVHGAKGYILTNTLLSHFRNWKLTLSKSDSSVQYLKKHNKEEGYSATKPGDIFLLAELAGNLPISDNKLTAFLNEKEDYVVNRLMFLIESSVLRMQEHENEKIKLTGNLLSLAFLNEKELPIDEISEILNLTRRSYFAERVNAIRLLSSFIFSSREDVFFDHSVIRNGIITLPEGKKEMKACGKTNKEPKISAEEYISLQIECIDLIQECLSKCLAYHYSRTIDGKKYRGAGYEITRLHLTSYRANKYINRHKAKKVEAEMRSSKLDPNTSFLSDGTAVLPETLDEAETEETNEYYDFEMTQAQVYFSVSWGTNPLQRYSQTSNCYLTAAACAIIELKIDNMRNSTNEKHRLLGNLLYNLYLSADIPNENRIQQLSEDLDLKKSQLYIYRYEAIALMSMMMAGLEPGSLGLLNEDKYLIEDDKILAKLDKNSRNFELDTEKGL